MRFLRELVRIRAESEPPLLRRSMQLAFLIHEIRSFRSIAQPGRIRSGVLQLRADTWISSLFSFLREGLDDLACLLACFDTAENEPYYFEISRSREF